MVYSYIPDSYAVLVARPAGRKTSVAANLRKRRDDLNLTQGELGKLARVAQGDISKYERGGSTPTAQVLVRLALALGVRVDDLLIGLDDDYDTKTEVTEKRWCVAPVIEARLHDQEFDEALKALCALDAPTAALTEELRWVCDWLTLSPELRQRGAGRAPGSSADRPQVGASSRGDKRGHR